MLEIYEYMILVISWVFTFCIVGAIITITFIKVNEWVDYRDEEDYSIIWGRGGKKPEPSNKDIDDLNKKFKFLKETIEILNKRMDLAIRMTTLLRVLHAQLQSELDDLTGYKVLPPSELEFLQTEIDNLINDENNKQNNGTNSATN